MWFDCHGNCGEIIYETKRQKERKITANDLHKIINIFVSNFNGCRMVWCWNWRRRCTSSPLHFAYELIEFSFGTNLAISCLFYLGIFITKISFKTFFLLFLNFWCTLHCSITFRPFINLMEFRKNYFILQRKSKWICTFSCYNRIIELYFAWYRSE